MTPLPANADDTAMDRAMQAYEEEDYQQALEIWLLNAYEGDPESQYRLGRMFSDGTGTVVDLSEAAYWFTRAAEQGNADAQFALGNAWYHGAGVRPDRAKALEWWHVAAENGSADAQYHLGRAYFYGIDVDQDSRQALAWFNRAVENGSKLAEDFLNRVGIENPASNSVSDTQAAGLNSSDWQGYAEVSDREIWVYSSFNRLSPILGKLEPGALLQVIEQNGGWFRVQVPGGVAVWVPAQSVVADGENYRINGAGLSGLPEPNNNLDIKPVGMFADGDEVIPIERKGDWLRVLSPETISGWVEAIDVNELRDDTDNIESRWQTMRDVVIEAARESAGEFVTGLDTAGLDTTVAATSDTSLGPVTESDSVAITGQGDAKDTTSGNSTAASESAEPVDAGSITASGRTSITIAPKLEGKAAGVINGSTNVSAENESPPATEVVTADQPRSESTGVAQNTPPVEDGTASVERLIQPPLVSDQASDNVQEGIALELPATESIAQTGSETTTKQGTDANENQTEILESTATAEPVIAQGVERSDDHVNGTTAEGASSQVDDGDGDNAVRQETDGTASEATPREIPEQESVLFTTTAEEGKFAPGDYLRVGPQGQSAYVLNRLSSARIELFPSGTLVKVMERRGDWVRIEVPGGIPLWIFSRFIEHDGVTGKITGRNVRARPLPSTSRNSQPVGIYPSGAEVQILSASNQWVRIRAPESLTAWMPINALYLVDLDDDRLTAEVASQRQQVANAANQLNIDNEVVSEAVSNVEDIQVANQGEAESKDETSAQADDKPAIPLDSGDDVVIADTSRESNANDVDSDQASDTTPAGGGLVESVASELVQSDSEPVKPEDIDSIASSADTLPVESPAITPMPVLPATPIDTSGITANISESDVPPATDDNSGVLSPDDSNNVAITSSNDDVPDEKTDSETINVENAEGDDADHSKDTDKKTEAMTASLTTQDVAIAGNDANTINELPTLIEVRSADQEASIGDILQLAETEEKNTDPSSLENGSTTESGVDEAPVLSETDSIGQGSDEPLSSGVASIDDEQRAVAMLTPQSDDAETVSGDINPSDKYAGDDKVIDRPGDDVNNLTSVEPQDSETNTSETGTQVTAVSPEATSDASADTVDTVTTHPVASVELRFNDLAWLYRQRDDAFSIEVIRDATRSEVEEAATMIDATDLVAFSSRVGGELTYNLMAGSYPDLLGVKQALDGLKDQFDSIKIRRIGAVQQEWCSEIDNLTPEQLLLVIDKCVK
ncbi:MAG: hypothetical protein DHS20C01_08230 [marine bacterium B5-7]|nr:MAG: hypothetical protein DHS20C01_08230 [marine bacterium B5-7]